MDLVYNPQNGRITVLLNGTANFNCQTDLDCPGLAQCKSQQEFSWLDGDNGTVTQCICPPYLGTHGALCDRPTRFTIGLILVSSITVVLVSAVLILCVLTFATMRAQNKRGSRTFQLAIAPAFVSAIFTLAYSAQWLERYSHPQDEYDIIVDGEKRSNLWIFERATFVLAFLPYTFALNNFSLLWIEALNGALMTEDKKQSSETVRRYKMFLVVFYIAIVAAVVVLIAMDDFESASFVCVPGVLIALIFYAIALRKILQASSQLSIALDQESGSSYLKMSGVNRLLRRVRNVAIRILIFTSLNALSAALYSLTENRPDGHHRQYFGMLVVLFATCNLLAISRFMYRMFSDSAHSNRVTSLENANQEKNPDELVMEAGNPKLDASPRSL